MSSSFTVPRYDQNSELNQESPPPHVETPSPHESHHPQHDAPKQNKLRAACDACHTAKIRCSDGTPCKTCRRLQISCVRSTSRRQGRPKGIRNKKTIEKEADTSKHSQALGIDRQENADANHTVPVVEDMVSVDFAVPFTCDSESFWNNYVYKSPKAHTINTSGASPKALYDADDTLMEISQDEFQPLGTWGMDIDKTKLQHDKQEQHQLLQNYVRDSDKIYKTDADESVRASTLYTRSLSTPTSSSLPSQDKTRVSCNCLQWSAQLLSSLKILALDLSATHPTDVVLMQTRNASDAWKQMLQRISCHENSAEEVMYLSISGIRIALRNLEVLFSQQDTGCEEGLNPVIIGSSSSIPANAVHSYIDMNQTIHANVGSNDNISPKASVTGGALIDTLHASIPCLSSLGSYAMDPQEQQIIAKIIALRLVRDLQEILQLLKDRLLSRGASSSSASESSSEVLFSMNRGSFSDEANWHLSAAREDSFMDLLPLLEKTRRASNMLLHRLRSLSMNDLGKL